MQKALLHFGESIYQVHCSDIQSKWQNIKLLMIKKIFWCHSNSSKHSVMAQIKQVQWLTWYVHKHADYFLLSKGSEAAFPGRALNVALFQAECLAQENNNK